MEVILQVFIGIVLATIVLFVLWLFIDFYFNKYKVQNHRARTESNGNFGFGSYKLFKRKVENDQTLYVENDNERIFSEDKKIYVSSWAISIDGIYMILPFFDYIRARIWIKRKTKELSNIRQKKWED